MEYERSDYDRFTLFTLSGDLDVNSAARLTIEARDAIQAGRARLLFDLAEVGFIDSNGIGALIEIYKAARVAGGMLAFAALQPTIQGIIRTVRLDQFFKIFPTRAEARRFLEGNVA